MKGCVSGAVVAAPEAAAPAGSPGASREVRADKYSLLKRVLGAPFSIIQPTNAASGLQNEVASAFNSILASASRLITKLRPEIAFQKKPTGGQKLEMLHNNRKNKKDGSPRRKGRIFWPKGPVYV